MPTIWHTLMVALVPVANLYAWRTLNNENAKYRWQLGFTNGLALGVSVFYTILFLPIAPIGIFFLVIGLGILPLTPPLALIATCIATSHLQQLRRQQNASGIIKPQNGRAILVGSAVALIAFVAIEFPATITRLNLQKAASDSPATRSHAIQRIRALGSEEMLLRACYSPPVRVTDFIGYIFSSDQPMTTEDARKTYYRVTGKTFDPPPNLPKRGLFSLEGDFDFTRGGERVGGILPGLSLATSRIDGSIDGDGALGYLEWTMVFKNSNTWQQEARAQIELPPGGVVSRLTLWVNGDEREAVFAARGKVRAAYESVVRLWYHRPAHAC